MKRPSLFLAAAACVGLSAALAEISDNVVKIGILNDQSGVYADFGGKWSVEAAKMAVEDFGGKVLGAPIEIVSADHQNKPDIASNIARQWYDTEQVDAIMELTTSSVALAVQAAVQGKEEDRHRHRRRDDRPDRQGLLALRLPLGLRHACAGGRHRRRARRSRAATPGSSSPPTTPSAIRWRSRPRAVVEAEGRQGAGRGAPPARHHRLLLLPAAGAVLGRQGHRPRQCRPRHLELDQAGGRVRHRRRAASGSRRCSSPSPRCTASASQAAQGAGADRGLSTGTATTRAAPSASASSSAPAACRTWSRPAPIRR